MKLALLTALAAAAVSALLPSAAAASPSVRYGVQDDAYLAAGPTLEPNLRTLDELGAKLVRYMVNWRAIAPTEPRHPAEPDDSAYNWTNTAAVAVAVATRYPWVRLWEVWNEPNLRTFLNPNSPRLYVRRLLNPTHDALVAQNPLNRVAGGAT